MVSKLIFNKVGEKDADAFYAKVAKYGGWQNVSAEARWEILQQVVEPSKLGFVAVKRGILARQASKEVVQLIKLAAYKGASCGLRFGVSLVWFPFPFEPTLRWHRSLKSADLHLFDEPHGLLGEDQPYFADHSLGKRCFREELGNIWKRFSADIFRWFDSTLTPGEVLQKCQTQMARPWPGPTHWPDPKVVYAFTLARCGNLDEGRKQLAEFFAASPQSDSARQNLLKAISIVGGAANRI